MSDRWYVNPQMLRRCEMSGDVAVTLEADHVEALRQAEDDAVRRVDEAEDRGFSAGQRDALAGAEQRVKAFFRTDEGRPSFEVISGVIAAIKGGAE